jgi:2-succinyl-5-enolpyruvyl-6-hydroxy-3-cyclohexene-1-carboxylate synthase
MSEKAPGLFLGAFVDELYRVGVSDVVISPGSRSTPLAMVFHASDFNVRVDVDERGAAFFALGLAKAKREPVALLCTSGTAAANYYPAICEAAAARVPLLVLTADRPHELRGLGATQTTDQLKMFGDMTVFFHEMPLPEDSADKIGFARQIAREAYIRAMGTPHGAAHLNFPFAEPLTPDLSSPQLFTSGRRAVEPLVAQTGCSLSDELVARLNAAIAGKRGVILCGEGDYPDEILGFSARTGFPVLADPLSNLRRLDEPAIIDNYDNIFRRADLPPIDLVIRFGQYPVSKAAFTTLKRLAPLTIVVDECESRDFNHLTDVFVYARPADFIAAAGGIGNDIGDAYALEWQRLNSEEAAKIAGASGAECEGGYVSALLEEAPEHSLLWAANSMAIRYVDTFYLKNPKDLTVMCNRGLNGIDGTLSSALGAAQCFSASTLLAGDLAMLHDINALQLQTELETNLTVVLINNRGGGIFEMLPQKSGEPYFERLFTTPRDVEYRAICEGFGVGYASADSVEEFREAYRLALAQSGINVVEIRSDLAGLKEQYLRYC